MLCWKKCSVETFGLVSNLQGFKLLSEVFEVEQERTEVDIMEILHHERLFLLRTASSIQS